MAITRRLGIVAVGVDSAAKLTPLDGAASGAADFVRWFKDNQEPLGVDVQAVLITDGGGVAVTSRQVKDAAQDFVDKRQVDVLILYLSAHGLIKSVGEEHVLLTDVARYPSEAINIAQTVENARSCGLGHVIIISDACRTPVVAGGFLDQVSGIAAVDRGNLVGGTKTPVDVFYASEPTQPAYEAKGVGFFTDVLLSVLKTCPADICENFASIDEERAVIPSWLLSDYLENAVPLAAAKHTPPFSQSPDIRVLSHEPRFFAYSSYATKADAPSVDPVANLTETGQTKKGLKAPLLLSQVQALRGLKELASMNVNDSLRLLDRAGIQLSKSEPPEHVHRRSNFETKTGYLVIGAKVRAVFCGEGSGPDLIDTSEGTDVRLYPPTNGSSSPGHRGSVLFEFEQGTLSVLPVMPGYIGVVEVDDGRIKSLSFQLSGAERAYLGASDSENASAQKRRLIAKDLATSGRLWRMGTAKANEHASFFRVGKRFDPTLGIYGAYAYAAAGNDEGSESIYDWFAHEYWNRPDGIPAAPVPFDVAMLASNLTPEAANRAPGFAPFCPLMTLGWSYLESRTHSHPLHPAILAAAEHRLSCEWTTFMKKDVGPMIDAFMRGEIL